MTSAAVLSTLADKIRSAAAQGRPLRIRGGGSKDFLGQSLRGEVLSTKPLTGVLAYEPSELVITLGAGTLLSEAKALLRQSGQCLPFEPPALHIFSTIGGVVAAGLSGPARASVGALRDFVLGAQCINGRGELLQFGGQVMKNVAGYDVSRLLAGSMGTLGLITRVSLKVLPLAPAECTLAFELSETSARQQLNRWCGQPLPLNASLWQQGQLLLRLRGAEAAVRAACRQLGGQALQPQKAERVWAAVRDQTLPFFRPAPGEGLWRISLPDTASPLNLGETVVEWHGSQRWLRLPLGDAARLRETVARAGGHVTLFRGGDGRTPVFSPLTPALLAVHQRLKQAFDPAGIFGPGRLYAEF